MSQTLNGHGSFDNIKLLEEFSARTTWQIYQSNSKVTDFWCFFLLKFLLICIKLQLNFFFRCLGSTRFYPKTLYITFLYYLLHPSLKHPAVFTYCCLQFSSHGQTHKECCRYHISLFSINYFSDFLCFGLCLFQYPNSSFSRVFNMFLTAKIVKKKKPKKQKQTLQPQILKVRNLYSLQQKS